MGDTKHSEMLQTNIQRLARNGFSIKGWTVTFLTAILGLTLKDGRATHAASLARDVAPIGSVANGRAG